MCVFLHTLEFFVIYLFIFIDVIWIHIFELKKQHTNTQRTVVISIQPSFHRIWFRFFFRSFSSSDNYCLVINRNYDIDERRAKYDNAQAYEYASDGEAKQSNESEKRIKSTYKIQNQKLYILHWIIRLVVLLFSLPGPNFSVFRFETLPSFFIFKKTSILTVITIVYSYFFSLCFFFFSRFVLLCMDNGFLY